TQALEIDGAEVRALATLHTTNILSAQDCRATTRAESGCFARGHQGAMGTVGYGIPREALVDTRHQQRRADLSQAMGRIVGGGAIHAQTNVDPCRTGGSNRCDPASE